MVAEQSNFADRFLGCILGGACGDALGAEVEFLSIAQIRDRYGPHGIAGYDGYGFITDDTQMTLFTLEGLIRAHHHARTHGSVDVGMVVQHAYQRWLHTQGIPWERSGGPFAQRPPDGWLISLSGLFQQRAPGQTCISALRAFAATGQPGTFTHRLNDSKGCGAVMRAAPVALWSDDPSEVFRLGAITGALTHSHPSGYLSAGSLGVIVHSLLRGSTATAAVDAARAELRRWDGHEEQLQILDAAVAAASRGRLTPEDLERELGGGWVGEEALAIGLYAALVADDFVDGLRLAVNHSGDSDSTGAICGNILAAQHGTAAIPAEFRRIELHDVITALCQEAMLEFASQPPTTSRWRERYPPS